MLEVSYYESLFPEFDEPVFASAGSVFSVEAPVDGVYFVGVSGEFSEELSLFDGVALAGGVFSAAEDEPAV